MSSGTGYSPSVTLVEEPLGVSVKGVRRPNGPSRIRRRRTTLIVACAAVLVAALTAWLWEDLTSNRAVYVVGDSITALSEAPISSDLSDAGYQAHISATAGIKIGQSQAEINALAQNQPWAWIIELGTNDAGANDTVWPGQFLEEWSVVSPATCVIYVTVSPRAGPAAQRIDANIQALARAHHNVHLLDWGNVEYQNPAWVTGDGIHPTPAGQAALALLESNELRRTC